MKVALNSAVTQQQRAVIPSLKLNSNASVMNDDPGVIFLGGSGQTTQTTSSRVVYVPTPSPSNNSGMPTIINASGNNNFLMNLLLTSAGLVAIVAGGRFAWKFAGEFGATKPIEATLTALKEQLGFSGSMKDFVRKLVKDYIDDPAVNAADNVKNGQDKNPPIFSEFYLKNELNDHNVDAEQEEQKKPSSIFNEFLSANIIDKSKALELSQQLQTALGLEGFSFDPQADQFVSKAFTVNLNGNQLFFVLTKGVRNTTQDAIKGEFNGLEDTISTYTRTTREGQQKYSKDTLATFLTAKLSDRVPQDLKIIYLGLTEEEQEALKQPKAIDIQGEEDNTSES